MNTNAQKIHDVRKCPRCGCSLFPPYKSVDGRSGNDNGDNICSHCKLPIIWEKIDVALEDESRN